MNEGSFLTFRCSTPVDCDPATSIVEDDGSNFSIKSKALTVVSRGWRRFRKIDYSRTDDIICLLYGWADSSRVGRLRAKEFAVSYSRSKQHLEALLRGAGGSFLLLLLDRDGFMLATDRFGSIPLYFRKFAGSVACSTSLFELLEGGESLNRKSAVSLIRFGCPHGNDTLVNGISVIEPATLLDCRVTIESMKYWRWQIESATTNFQNTSLSPSSFQSEFNRSLLDAAGLLDVPNLAVGLSGGLDTRLLTGLISHNIGNRFVGYTFWGDKKAGDLAAAEILARHLGVKQIKLHLDAQDFLRESDSILDANNGVLLTASFLFWTLAKALKKDHRNLVITPSAEIFFGSRIKPWICDPDVSPWDYLIRNEPQCAEAISAFVEPELLRECEAEEAGLLGQDEYVNDAQVNAIDAHVKWDLANRQRRMIFPNVAGTMSSLVDVFEAHWSSGLLDLLIQLPAEKRMGRCFQRALIRHVDDSLTTLPEAADGLPIKHKLAYRYARSLLLRLGPFGKKCLRNTKWFCDFEGPYHFYRKWWYEPPAAMKLREIVEGIDWVGFGVLASNDLRSLYRDCESEDRRGEEASLFLYSLYTLAIAVNHWRLR